MNKKEALVTTEDQGKRFPALVEAEKMFDKFADVSREIARRAYSFFLDRDTDFNDETGDWFRAETETLRAAPARVTETKDEVHVKIAAPGFKPDEIELSIKDQLLFVSGESKEEKTEEHEDLFFNEWSSDRFIRRLALPSPVETEKVEALLKDGILTLTLKKKQEHEATKVAVKGA